MTGARPIAKGDMVIVVRPEGCGCDHKLGRIFVVDRVRVLTHVYCTRCGSRSHFPNGIAHAFAGKLRLWTATSLLRRIGDGTRELLREVADEERQ